MATIEPASARLFQPAFPFHMVWLATDACTARCLHCSSNSATRSPDEMSTAEALDMIDQLADCGVVDLGISGGEPMLRSDLLQVIAHAKARGMAVGLASNGAKLPASYAGQLAALGLNRLQISLDGTAGPHDKLRQWPGLYQRALRSIDTAQAAGLRVHVCCTISSLNVDELEEFAEAVLALKVARINFSRYVPTGRASTDLDLPDQRWRAVVERCAALKERYRGRLEIVTHLAQQILVDADVACMDGFVGCQAGRGQGCISANGNVLPCVLLPVVAGNLRQARFREIWSNAPVIRGLKDREKLAGKCGGCAVRERCGGCRAVAFARTGSLTATDPRCWLPGDEHVVSLHPLRQEYESWQPLQHSIRMN